MDGCASNLHDEYVQSRFDKITKSRTDKREYRGLILKNQMKVLLISDSTTDKSAASLNVEVGSMSDPADLQGLAHLCEHILFPGNKQFSNENDFNTYISRNGGSTNASTGLDYTNYYFDLNADNLSRALNRFSQCFLNPKFTECIIKQEIQAVHSEFEDNLLNDDWRLEQLDKFSANPKHPYSYFNIGNTESLEMIPRRKNIDVRQELMKFFNYWYSANIMSLCVLGKENLNNLEKMVVTLFASVKNKNVKAPKWIEHPFNEDHFQCKWYIIPMNNTRQLSVTFPIPDIPQYYQSSPTVYLSYLFCHEGKGSLISVLREKGWCISLNCGKSQPGKGFAFFSFEILLTEKGIDFIDDIIASIFQYINMVKKAGPTQWIFNECVSIQSLNFNFMEEYSPISLVRVTTHDMQKYPIEEVLRAPYCLTKWEPNLINLVIHYLRPQNIRVKIMAQDFEHITTDVEPWYKTKFEKEKIPKNVIEQWSNVGFNCDYKLPEENEFIPDKLSLKLDISVIEKFPKIIRDTPTMRVWYKQDDEFLLPKGILILQFDNLLSDTDPKNFGNSVMFVQLVQNAMSDYSYSAKLAGLEWDITNDKNGITLFINGYDNKQLVLLEKIIDKMTNFEIDETMFQILKKMFIRELKNMDDGSYFEKCSCPEISFYENLWNKDVLLDAYNSLTVKNFKNFVSKIFTKSHVECLIYGNFTKIEALKIASLIELKFTTVCKSKQKIIVPLLPKILEKDASLDGFPLFYEIKDKMNVNFGTLIYYPNETQSTDSNMLLELFAQIIAEPILTILNANKQLAFTEQTKTTLQNKLQLMRIYVQSDRQVQYNEFKLENYLESIKIHIKNMTEEEFKKHKELIVRKKFKKPKSMPELSAVFWREITSKTYKFNRADLEIECLNAITKQQILEL